MRRLALLLPVLLLPLLARAGEVKDTGDLLKKNKITIQKAADAALEVSPGTAVSAKLVKSADDGSASWRVLVLKGERLTEVSVDGVSARATIKSSWKDEDEAEKARAPRPGDGD
jgi:uncharacterized membrane protein YkoI